MPNPSLARVARAAVARAAGPEWSDGRLVGRYVATGDEAAFAGLVARHGPMVLAVCRRVAGDPHLADDAFQATFLVLARRAAGVSPREAVRGWLYGVAVRTAREARHMAARRRRREVVVPAVPDRPAPEPSPPDVDALRALDEEIARLAEPLRAAVVLCELDGLTRRDAAARLGIPEGTLSSRLAKARKLLAARLKGRGITAPLTALTVAAPVPAALADAAAGLGGAAPVSAAVIELTRGVFRTMLLSKLKLVSLPATAVVLVAGVMSGVGGPARSDDPPPAPAAAAKPADPPALPKFTEVRTIGSGKLLVEREGKLWLANPDGTRPVTINPPAGRPAVHPRLSPDHRHVAFIARGYKWPQTLVGDIGVRGPDQVVIRDRLDRQPDLVFPVSTPIDIAWSPDGTRLVVGEQSSVKGIASTWLIDPGTGSKTRLALPEASWVQDWSRDGKSLLVVMLPPDKAEARMNFQKEADLMLVGLDGTPAETLTRLTRFSPGHRLSPDGTKVLFVDGDPDEKPGPDEDRARLHLYLLDVKSKTRTRVAAVPKEAFVRGCAWSPNGRRFAFTYAEVHPGLNKKAGWLSDAEVDTRSYLVVCRADGSNPETVVADKSLFAFDRTLGAIDWR